MRRGATTLALLGKVALRKIVQTTTGEAILGGNVILRQAVEAKVDEVWGMGWVHRGAACLC